MEQIPEDKYFKYNPDTLIAMRKVYNLDQPGQMDEAIDLLDAWIKKQSHFVKKDFSREYLERVIMLLKGSVERAKNQIEKICTLRTLLPHFFEKIDIKRDYNLVKNHFTTTLLPRLTKEHHRVYLIRLEPEFFTSKIFTYMYYYHIIMWEYVKAHDFSDGIITVIDLRNINSVVEFVTKLNLTELKQIMTIFLQGFGTRAKQFVMMSDSSTIDIFIKLFKQFLSEKLGQRIKVVRDLEGLHEHVPKALLPADYGGEEKLLNELRDELNEVFASKENIEYLKEMSKARTDEALRTTNNSDDFLGIAGTFRTLSVD